VAGHQGAHRGLIMWDKLPETLAGLSKNVALGILMFCVLAYSGAPDDVFVALKIPSPSVGRWGILLVGCVAFSVLVFEPATKAAKSALSSIEKQKLKVGHRRVFLALSDRAKQIALFLVRTNRGEFAHLRDAKEIEELIRVGFLKPLEVQTHFGRYSLVGDAEKYLRVDYAFLSKSFDYLPDLHHELEALENAALNVLYGRI
jgi:hypothetical protein